MANTYLFTRSDTRDMVDLEPEAMAGTVFYNLWAVKKFPYNVLANGDTMLLFETKTRRLIWQLRVAALLREPYATISGALDKLRTAYGIIPNELDAYRNGRPEPGYLLAWAGEVIQRLDVPMPNFSLVRYGSQTGYLAFDALKPKDRPKLPRAPRRAPIGLPAAFIGGDDSPIDRISRTIPAAVKQQVEKRDGGRCQECGRGRDEIALHFDHRYPFSRGGGHHASNLQLLCAEHNLRKGAKVPDGVTVPVDASRRRVAAARAHLPDTSSLKEVIDAAKLGGDDITLLLLDEIAHGRIDEALSVEDLAGDQRDLVRARAAEALAGQSPRRAASLARALLGNDDDMVATVAAYALAVTLGPGKRRSTLLEHAHRSPDSDVVAKAALAMAFDVYVGADDELSDEERAAYQSLCEEAFERGGRDTRAEAAFELAWLFDTSNEGFDPDELTDLLRVGLTHSDPVKGGWSAFELARIYADWETYAGFEVPAHAIEDFLNMAESSGDAGLKQDAHRLRKSIGL
jgi:hypothetical protein